MVPAARGAGPRSSARSPGLKTVVRVQTDVLGAGRADYLHLHPGL